MKKRILSFLLALCMCLTLVPVTVLADDDVQQINDAAVQAITPGSDVSVLSVVPDTGAYHTYEFYVDSEKIDTQIVKNGDTLYEPPVTAPAGKTFTGWNPNVTFGTVSNVDKTETIRVKAQFADGYHVYFKDDSGRIIATETVTNGTEVSVAKVNFPVGSDEAITGWYTDKDYTNKVDSVTINGADITLYAKVEKGYWLTFESNGGSYVAPAFYAKDTAAAAPTDAPTKLGYAFGGWYTDKDLKTPASFGSITASTTLYAKWTAGTETKYTVIHFWENANDDGYSFKESETKTGTTGRTTNAVAKSYQGFTVQPITQETIAGDGSTIVSVKYTRKVYSVKFFSNSGFLSPSKEYTSLRITAKYGASIGDQWPTYSGSNAWATSDGGSTYQSNIDTMPLNGASFYGPGSGWGSETAYYYVEVLPGETGTNLNGVTYKEHHHDTSPGTGYRVTKEDKYPITGFTCNITLSTRNGQPYDGAKFYYTRNSYDIVFVNNGAKEKTVSRKFEQSIADASYTPTAPAGMTDYVFAGWYDNKLGEGNAYEFTGKTMPAQTITLYAKWVAPTYTVTVYDVDGSVHYTFNKVAKNSTISSDVIPDLKLAEGETFLGWVQKDGTPFSFSTKINQNYDLYAKVGNNSRYTVTYHSNTTPDATVTDDTMIYAKDVLATVNDNSFTNGDMVFLGWNTKDDGTGTTYYPNSTVKITGDVTLYAQWGDKASTVSVTYHSNFGTDVAQSAAAVANNSKITVEAYNALNLPERTGYSFVGWTTEANGSGTKFSAGDSARVDNGSNDLYAQWEINQYNYTVEYYIDNVKNDSMTETGKADFGTVIDSYTNKCPDGYVLEKTENLPLTISVNGNANVINVFYKKNVFNLTIHYVYAEGGAVAAPDHTENVTFNSTYSVTSPTINGYTADTTVVSGTMPAENVEVTVTYTKRTDLSYTVHYYWNGTTESVAPDKTVPGQTFNASVTESPIAIEGYTAVSKASQTITIGTGTNEINFYYYKNVELTANSDEVTYDGEEHSVSGFTGAPADADFSAITVGAKGTEVGTYPANFTEGTKGTVDANKKYIVTEANNGQLKINPVTDKVTVTINGHKDTKTYDGKEHSVTGYDVTITGGNNQYTTNDFSFTGTAEAKGTNVKTDGYSMGLTAAQFTNTSKNFSNVKFEVTDGKLTINPRKVTLTSGSASKEYDGTPLTNKTVSVTGDGFVTGEGATYDVTGTITNVADNKPNNNTFTYTLSEGTTAGNYVIEIMCGTLEITPVAAEVTVTIKGNTTDAVYDATEKTAEGYDVISISNELYTANDFALTGKDKVTGIAAGEYDMGLAFENISKNFSKVTFVVEDGKLTIAKRDVTVTGESATKVYNGQTQEINGYTVDNLVKGYEMTGVTYSAKGKDPGKYDGSFTGRQIVIKDAAGTDVTANYNVKTVIGALTITQPSHPTRPSTPTKDVTSVKTADGSQMTLWMSMMLASAAGIVFLGKKRKEEQ